MAVQSVIRSSPALTWLRRVQNLYRRQELSSGFRRPDTFNVDNSIANAGYLRSNAVTPVGMGFLGTKAGLEQARAWAELNEPCEQPELYTIEAAQEAGSKKPE